MESLESSGVVKKCLRIKKKLFRIKCLPGPGPGFNKLLINEITPLLFLKPNPAISHISHFINNAFFCFIGT